MRILQFSLKAFLLLPAMLVALMSFFVFRTHDHSIFGDERYRAFYNGLDLVEGSGPFGRNYHSFVIDDLPDRISRISHTGNGLGILVSKYSDGTVAVNGECRIEFGPDGAIPLLGDLRNAESFKPDGTLAARVVDGNGTAIWFYPNGLPNCEVQVVSGRPALMRYFDRSGNKTAEQRTP